jgi:hypothetical protein
MLVMSDVDDVFLPKPNDLLVNLSECRASLESLLGRLNDMFAENHAVGSALGPALQSGFKLIVSFLVLTIFLVFIPIRILLAVNSSYCPPACRALVRVRSRTGKIRRFLALQR